MARPIKETPVLEGDAADKFVKALEKETKMSDKKINQMKDNYNKLKSIAQF